MPFAKYYARELLHGQTSSLAFGMFCLTMGLIMVAWFMWSIIGLFFMGKTLTLSHIAMVALAMLGLGSGIYVLSGCHYPRRTSIRALQDN